VKGDTLAAVASLSRTRRYQEHVAVRCCVCFVGGHIYVCVLYIYNTYIYYMCVGKCVLGGEGWVGCVCVCVVYRGEG
jgi:hypothetical protein